MGAATEPVATGGYCTAFVGPVAVSGRQQELVCVAAGFTGCPRYLRGSLLLEPPRDVRAEASSMPRSIRVSLLLVAASIALSVFGVVVGLVPMPGSVPVEARVGGVAASPAVTGTMALLVPVPTAPGVTVTPGQLISPTATKPPSPAPSAATPSPAPSASATRSWPPGASASRMELVRACHDTAGCYVYLVRAGDNVWSIARFFGVAVERIVSLNPWLGSRTVWAGDELRIPPPTR